MAKKNPLDVVAERVAEALERDVKALTAKLSSELAVAGASKLTRQKYLELWHRNWADPAFRLGMLKQVGPKHFLETARDMVATHGHPVLPGEGGPQNGFVGHSTGPMDAPPGGGPDAGGGGGAPGAGAFGPPAAPVSGVPLPPYVPQPPSNWTPGG